MSQIIAKPASINSGPACQPNSRASSGITPNKESKSSIAPLTGTMRLVNSGVAPSQTPTAAADIDKTEEIRRRVSNPGLTRWTVLPTVTGTTAVAGYNAG